MNVYIFTMYTWKNYQICFHKKYHYLKHKDIYKAEQDTNGALCEIVDQNFKLTQFYNSNLLIYTKLQELT